MGRGLVLIPLLAAAVGCGEHRAGTPVGQGLRSDHPQRSRNFVVFGNSQSFFAP